MSEYRDKDNKEFLDLIDLVHETLKGTNYKMFISIDEPDVEWDEEHPHEDWLDYDKYDKNPEFKNNICYEDSGWGQIIRILDPDTQAPYRHRGGDANYRYPIVEIWQNYEDYDQYTITRNAAYMYDVIHYGQTTNDDDYEERYSNYKTVINYVKKDLLNDLKLLSETNKKLAEIHAADGFLAKIKYKKQRNDD